MRQYTEQEAKAFMDAEPKLRAQGLIVDDADGKQEVDVNTRKIVEYFEQNRRIPINIPAILAACDQMKDHLHWKSAAQMQYDFQYNTLTQAQKDAFGAFWFTQKKTLILEGDEGFENAAKILNWMRGKSFDSRMFGIAVSNLVSTVGLHLVRESSFRPGRHSGGDSSFMKKSETNLSERDHKRMRDDAANAAAGRASSTPVTDFRSLAEAVRGRTHSQTEQIQRMYVNRPGTSEIDWEATYAARRRAAGL